MKTNKKAKDYRVDRKAQLAGGYGKSAAVQNAEMLLRRAVMACLLWEDNAYISGKDVVGNIRGLIPHVEPMTVAGIALEARTKQKLRHVPLLIAREMAKLESHRRFVGNLLPQIIKRPDEITEFMALYWKEGRQPLAKQVKKGLAAAFRNFDEYQLAKYNRPTEIKLRDVLFLVHAKPVDAIDAEFNRNVPAPRQTDKVKKKGYSRGSVLRHEHSVFTRLVNGTMEVPDTWEVSLSAGKDKKETWERLIKEKKLGALAFLRNLRNMEKAKVNRGIIQWGFENINPRWLLPLNYLSAAKAAPDWMREIESLMFKGFSQSEKLSGHTVLIVDVSGSMDAKISSKSDFSRMDAAIAMALMASEVCEHISVYATAGHDGIRKHKTEKLSPYRGFALHKEIKDKRDTLGVGGIFTRQCLEHIRDDEKETDRIMIFSDSQDCDFSNSKTPDPFGKTNYIIDVSSESRGINYDGIWTSEISGWSEHFLTYIMALEGLNVSQQE